MGANLFYFIFKYALSTVDGIFLLFGEFEIDTVNFLLGSKMQNNCRSDSVSTVQARRTRRRNINITPEIGDDIVRLQPLTYTAWVFYSKLNASNLTLSISYLFLVSNIELWIHKLRSFFFIEYNIFLLKAPTILDSILLLYV